MITTTLRKTEPTFGDSPILLHGDYGVGKTLLASQFDKPYFLMCEPNDDYANILYHDNCSNWNDCVEKIHSFLNDNHDFKTIVIDNMNNFFEFAVQAFINDFNANLKKNQAPIINLSDIGYAKGYDAVDNLIKIVLNPLIMNNKFNKIFISHSEEREITTLTGEVFHTIIPLLPSKRARKYLFSLVPNIFYYHYFNNQRYIQITGNDFVMAKNRGLNHFLTTSGETIINVPAGKSPQEAYKYLLAAYNNKLKNSYKDIK